jgi:indolepyruvate ferredoxin oxidoreductase beta subunit
MQIVINGVGGQGVLFLSKLLTKVALQKKINIQSSETIGMAQRGGSVISFLKIGNEYKSPMIIPGTGDMLICLNENEYNNGVQYIKEDGLKYVNSDNFFNATKLAIEKKVPNMTNIIFLGFLTKLEKFPFKKEEIYNLLNNKLEQCFNFGYNAVLI